MAAHSRPNGHAIYFALWFLLSSSSIFFPHLISAVADWMSAILSDMVCGLSANLRCRCTMCCARLAEIYRTQKVAKKIAIWAPSHNFLGP